MPVPLPPAHWTFRGRATGGAPCRNFRARALGLRHDPPAAPARIAKTPTAYETRASLAPRAEWRATAGGALWRRAARRTDAGGAGRIADAGRARARVRRAEAAAAQAHAAQLPTVSASASAQELKQS